MQGSEKDTEHRHTERHYTEHRAAAPELPPPAPLFDEEREEQRRYRAERERAERRSVVRGLILLAVLVLVGSMVHAGWGRVFVHGWWRP
jgi:hypothetical protein